MVPPVPHGVPSGRRWAFPPGSYTTPTGWPARAAGTEFPFCPSAPTVPSWQPRHNSDGLEGTVQHPSPPAHGGWHQPHWWTSLAGLAAALTSGAKARTSKARNAMRCIRSIPSQPRGDRPDRRSDRANPEERLAVARPRGSAFHLNILICPPCASVKAALAERRFARHRRGNLTQGRSPPGMTIAKSGSERAVTHGSGSARVRRECARSAHSDHPQTSRS